MEKNINVEIRAYIRANSHLNDDIIADKFDVSRGSVSANRAHITMGTDTDHPQARAKSVIRTVKKGLTLIKTSAYELRINEDGQYTRLDIAGKKFSKITDDEAKAIMMTKIGSQ
jgi:hypothetical protein